ncbi:MAG: prepilin peptidase [Acetobacteraceae bacterium]|nr:prepilin peptidase [Acetobacteraceae bacterium]
MLRDFWGARLSLSDDRDPNPAPHFAAQNGARSSRIANPSPPSSHRAPEECRVPGALLPLILSPFIGSFLGVLIRRLPIGQPVLLARSRCESCGHVLTARELVPLASFFALGGRCRWCRARISVAHLWVELACVAIAVWVLLAESDPLLVWLDCILGWTLLVLAWIDWTHLLLPDALTLPLVLAGLGATWLLDPGSISNHAAAAVAGYGSFRAIEVTYRWLRGREGLGQGDAKLMAAAGAWVGLESLATLVLVAALIGLAVAIGLRIGGRVIDRQTAIPFGPALCVATWAVWMGFNPITFLVQNPG